MLILFILAILCFFASLRFCVSGSTVPQPENFQNKQDYLNATQSCQPLRSIHSIVKQRIRDLKSRMR